MTGGEFEFGLSEVAGNPTLTFIFFIGLMLLAVVGFRFAYYAHRNAVTADIESQFSIWRSLRGVGLLGGLYGVVGLLEIASSLQVDEKNGLLLGMTLLLALSLRQVHASATTDPELSTLERAARGVFVAAILVYVGVVFVTGQSTLTAIIEGGSALAFLTYGLAYFHDHTSNARLQGTMLDSLLRHLFPVLTFASMASVVVLAIPLGLGRAVVLHVQVVFLVMTATALMAATIRLRQNLASL